MKTSIETISGKLCTVIPKAITDHRVPLSIKTWPTTHGFEIYHDIGEMAWKHAATALYALPRNPKPEDAALLYRYASEKIFARGKKQYPAKERLADWGVELVMIEAHPFHKMVEITHCVDATDNRVDVAIEGVV